MRNLLFLRILLILVFGPLCCCFGLVCLSADYQAVGDNIDKALKLKQAGDIEAAISTIKKAVSIINTDDSLKEEIYTKQYLQTLIECLKAQETTYIAIINYTNSVVEKTRDTFLEIADELKTGKISTKGASAIKEMKLEMSKAMVTHSFCVPPGGYQEVYDVVQQGLFRYSQAWGNLYQIAFEQPTEKTKLQAEALFSFQKGNQHFSQAGTLMLAISSGK